MLNNVPISLSGPVTKIRVALKLILHWVATIT